jgi:DNA (cytosine-5)-methyltransferase 1
VRFSHASDDVTACTRQSIWTELVSPPRIIDLYCGAGGAAMGYHLAGFDVIGMDIKPQPHYPFPFIRGDAMSLNSSALMGAAFIHASPPCQAFTAAQPIQGNDHPDLLTPTRERLLDMGIPFVLENVPGAPMRRDVELCGSMFDLELQRHRWFEFDPPHLLLTPPCRHVWAAGSPVGVYGHTGGRATRSGHRRSGNHGWLKADWERAMGIDWMSRDELAQAVPPAYTRWIGSRLMRELDGLL